MDLMAAKKRPDKRAARPAERMQRPPERPRPVHKQTRVRISLTMDPDIHGQLLARSQRWGVTPSRVIDAALGYYFANVEETPDA